MEELFADRPVDIPAMIKHMKMVAAAEGLPLGDRTRTYNSRLAQEMAKWAEAKGRGEEFHMAAFRAYFAAGKNIAEMDSLLEMATSVGLNPDEAQKIIEERTYGIWTSGLYPHFFGISNVLWGRSLMKF